MAEFTYPLVQTVPYRQSAILNSTRFGCNKGYIFHREGSGIVTARGIVNNPCSNFARYECKFSGNIALSEGATVGELAAALAINGEILQDTIAVATPAAVGDFWHVSGFAYIDVPRGCCYEITVENASPQATPATPNPSIDIRNLNVAVNRVG